MTCCNHGHHSLKPSLMGKLHPPRWDPPVLCQSHGIQPVPRSASSQILPPIMNDNPLIQTSVAEVFRVLSWQVPRTVLNGFCFRNPSYETVFHKSIIADDLATIRIECSNLPAVQLLSPLRLHLDVAPVCDRYKWQTIDTIGTDKIA